MFQDKYKYMTYRHTFCEISGRHIVSEDITSNFQKKYTLYVIVQSMAAMFCNIRLKIYMS